MFHHWGGIVISEVGTHERVKSLVYVAAFAASEGPSAAELGKDYPTPPGLSFLVPDREGFPGRDGRGRSAPGASKRR